MFTLITPDCYSYYQKQLDEMFALRYRVFCTRLGWVEGQGGQERDNYDDLSPTYLIHQNRQGNVTACVRLLPTTGPNMLRNTFPELLDGKKPPEANNIWEASRLAVDTHALRGTDKTELPFICIRLFLAMIKYGLKNNLSEFVAVMDLQGERLVRYSGWKIYRLGAPKKIGNTWAVALAGEISQNVWRHIVKRAQVEPPIFSSLAA